MALLVLGVLAILLGNVRYDQGGVEASFLGHLSALRLNEMGDALAGIFGSLAFLVAAGAIYLQSRELAAQREELRLTREVMEEQRIAATDMAASMKVQAAIFEQEQKDRVLQSADKELEALVSELAALLQSPELKSLVWRLDGSKIGHQGIVDSRALSKPLHVQPHEGYDLYHKVGAQLYELTSMMSEIEDSLKQPGFAQKPVRGEILQRILLSYVEVEKRSLEASNALKANLRVARLSSVSSLTYEKIREFEQNSELWADPQ